MQDAEAEIDARHGRRDHRAVPAIDPTLEGAARSTLGKMQHDLQTLHGKIIQAAKRRDETLRRQFTTARAGVPRRPAAGARSRVRLVPQPVRAGARRAADEELPLDIGHALGHDDLARRWPPRILAAPSGADAARRLGRGPDRPRPAKAAGSAVGVRRCSCAHWSSSASLSYYYVLVRPADRRAAARRARARAAARLRAAARARTRPGPQPAAARSIG